MFFFLEEFQVFFGFYYIISLLMYFIIAGDFNIPLGNG